MTETTKTLTVTYDRAENRSKVVPLKWPFSVNGTRYESVTVRRMTTGEVDAWLRAVAGDGSRRPPMFDVPDDVFDLIDGEDGEVIDAVVNDFLPPRFRPAPESTTRTA